MTKDELMAEDDLPEGYGDASKPDAKAGEGGERQGQGRQGRRRAGR